jgi:ABC-2 type transport system permease protein
MLGVDATVIKPILRKELSTWLANPTGYVFLTLFIATTGAAAFLQAGFFQRNLADLALLNQFMPAVLMLFVPAVTMNVWSEERRTGTEELLLTLPVRDTEVIIGKYLGALGVYSVALGFSLAHLGVLSYLGSPDVGLMFATYLGYWLMGALFVSIGLLGSMFSSNATVAFILGALGCAGLTFAGLNPWASGIVGTAIIGGLCGLTWLVVTRDARRIGWIIGAGVGLGMLLWVPDWSFREAFTDAFGLIGVGKYFYNFGQGIIRVADVAYFLGGICVLLYLSTFLVGRRHWS